MRPSIYDLLPEISACLNTFLRLFNIYIVIIAYLCFEDKIYVHYLILNNKRNLQKNIIIDHTWSYIILTLMSTNAESVFNLPFRKIFDEKKFKHSFWLSRTEDKTWPKIQTVLNFFSGWHFDWPTNYWRAE